MGKKSKRNRAKACQQSAAAAPKEENSAEPECPKDGWIIELRDAKDASKRKTNDAKAHHRLAVAAFQVRQWKKCLSASTKGLSLQPEKSIAKALAEFQERATEELEKISGSRIHGDEMKRILQRVLKEDINIDCIHAAHTTFDNLNLLQYAGMMGDVPLFEEIISLGAAIDYPVLEGSSQVTRSNLGFMLSAPEGSTILGLLCATLAMHSQMKGAPLTPEVKQTLKGNLECAILLVKMGADCSRAFGRSNMAAAHPIDLYHHFQMYGKSVRELARMSGKKDLIGAVRDFESKDARIKKALCRCKSRLPWNQCHSGERYSSPVFFKGKTAGDVLHFRYSPMAPCSCKSGKTYWKCCWQNSPNPLYQDDTTSNLVGLRTATVPAAIQAMADRVQALKVAGADENTPLFPEFESMSSRDFQRTSAYFIRSQGMDNLCKMTNRKREFMVAHPKSKLASWDADVYAGCIERLDDFFYWNDIHWFLEKGELKKRAEEWNEALNQYCDDKRLAGKDRDAIIEKHSASVCAPCANLNCTAFETHIKEFPCCGKCKSVAYCSRDCQREDHPKHKSACFSK